MSIDWITVGAQILNFLVLVWLLKRFFYRPILDGIDARESEIAARMGEADAIRETAAASEANYKAEIASLRASRAEVLEEARRAAEQERDTLLAQARERLTREQADREKHRSEEAQQFTAGLHESGAEALLALTRKVLSDLADETLEQRIVAHSAEQIKDMAKKVQEAAGQAREAVVLTRDPLPEKQQALLRDELASVLPDFTFRFDNSPDISPGLILRLGGVQVTWTVDSYLDGLDAVLEDISDRSMRKG